jgi:hypothetical protein
MKIKYNLKKLFSSNSFFMVVSVFFLLSFFILGFSKIGNKVLESLKNSKRIFWIPPSITIDE